MLNLHNEETICSQNSENLPNIWSNSQSCLNPHRSWRVCLCPCSWTPSLLSPSCLVHGGGAAQGQQQLSVNAVVADCAPWARSQWRGRARRIGKSISCSGSLAREYFAGRTEATPPAPQSAWIMLLLQLLAWRARGRNAAACPPEPTAGAPPPARPPALALQLQAALLQRAVRGAGGLLGAATSSLQGVGMNWRDTER